MADKYILTDNWDQYNSSLDETISPESALVAGSQNIEIGVDGKFRSRRGIDININQYYKGTAVTVDPYSSTGSYVDGNPTVTAMSWEIPGISQSTIGGNRVVLASNNTKMHVTIPTELSVTINAGTVITNTLPVDLSVPLGSILKRASGRLVLSPYFNQDIGKQILMISGGYKDTVLGWSGAIGIAKYTNATTLEVLKAKQNNWTDFTPNAGTTAGITGQRKFAMLCKDGTWKTYEYTAVGTDSFTVTTDLTAEMHSGGNIIVQIPFVLTLGLTDMYIDVVKSIENELYYGDGDLANVWKSKRGYVKTFIPSSPRSTGDGYTLDLPGKFNTVIQQGEKILISAGVDFWSEVKRTELTNGNTTGAATVEKLDIIPAKTGDGIAVYNHHLTANWGNSIVYVDKNKKVRMFGELSDLESIRVSSISDQIEKDIYELDLTNASIDISFDTMYLCAPSESKIYVYNIFRNNDGTILKYWNPVALMGLARIIVIPYNPVTKKKLPTLVGTALDAPITRRAFYGYDDAGLDYTCIAKLAYNSYGKRNLSKSFQYLYTEGRISRNTLLKVEALTNLNGSEGYRTKIIEGSMDRILSIGESEATLVDGLDETLIGDNITTQNLNKFRVEIEFDKIEGFEFQYIFSSTKAGSNWGIIAVGPYVTEDTNKHETIKI